MRSPNRIYNNLALDEDRTLTLEATTGPFNPNIDGYEFNHAWFSGLKDGWPGFGRRYTMNDDHIREYMGLKREPGKKGSPSAPRGAMVFSTYEGVRELTGIAVYGATSTKEGLRQRMEQDRNPVHVPLFEIVGETRGRRQLSLEEQGFVAVALAHTLGVDAQNHGFDWVSYKPEVTTQEEILGQLEQLDLTKENWDLNPNFSSTVLRPEEMYRSEWAVDLAQANVALLGLHRWLGDGQPLVARADVAV